MGNPVRQAAAGKRLASLHQRTPPQGAPNVQTANVDEHQASATGGDTRSHENPKAFTVQHVASGEGQAIPGGYEATLHPTTHTTPVPRDNQWVSPPAVLADRLCSLPKSRDGQAGSSNLQNATRNQGDAPKPVSTADTAARAEETQHTSHFLDELGESIYQKQDHKSSWRTASNTSRLDGSEDQSTGLQHSLHLEWKAKLAQTDGQDGTCEFEPDPDTSALRASSSIMLKNRSIESVHAPRGANSTSSDCTLPSETLPIAIHHEEGGAASRSLNDGQATLDLKALHIGSASENLSGIAGRAALTVSRTSPSTTDSLRIRAPTLSFKAKKLRGKFDAGALEAQFGVELSAENAQRLRALSGDEMGAAISLYLQGYCNPSESQSPDTSSQRDEQHSRIDKHRNSGGSVSSVEFWQRKRQTDKSSQSLDSEIARGSPSQRATLLVDSNSVTQGSEQGCAPRDRQSTGFVLGKVYIPEPVSPPGSAQDDSGCDIHPKPSSERAVPEDKDRQGGCGSSSCIGPEGAGAQSDIVPAIGGVTPTDEEVAEADEKSEHSGTGPVPLRGMQAFANQENVRPRNPPSSTSRLPNGKLGSGSGWGAFGMPMGGAPGLQSVQQRNMGGNSGIGSFAQNVGGSQPATPLDPLEFPSLSGTPQTQQQNPGQAIWAQRPAQQNPTQNSRQQQSQPSQPNSLQIQPPSQPSHEDMFSAASHFSTGLGDYGQGNQQLSGSTQPQTGNIDEFPPLGRESSSGLGQERRGSLLQSSTFGGYGAGMAFAGMTQQQRSLLSSALDRERMASPAGSGMGLISTSRSPNPPGQNGNAAQEKLGTIGSGADGSNRQGDFANQSQQQLPHQSSQMMNNTFGGNDLVDSPSSLQQAGPQPLEQMSDADKFGLPGLLAMMHHPSADLRSLTAQGQDLTTLGLDLTSTEPLHTHLASVFNPTAHTRLPLDADYTLPACYRVANVQNLHERIPSFSEETLFYIFYSSPKDVVQELVADELIGRKWRFHKGEKMWVTRDENYPAPVEVEREISEQGFYIWWDWKGWKKVRRQYILRYEDLDNGSTRNGSALNQMALSAAAASSAVAPAAAGIFNR